MQSVEFIDNVNKTLSQSIKEEIKPGSKVSIAAACFSIYAYQELQNQLKNIDELRFIFTSPTFVTDKAKKENREFYIPRLNRERSLYGTEFEVKLRNELNQKAIAKECAEWIKKKATFKSNSTQQSMPSFINIDEINYNPVKEFTAVELGVEKGNNAAFGIMKTHSPISVRFLQMFEQFWQNKDIMQDVTDQIIESITSAYTENSPEFIYFITLYNIFKEFLDDISEDVLPKEATGFKQSAIWKKLYNFQQDACLAIINKLEKYNGCILADSVGLGKTFTALSVIKYFESRNNRVLVLCPKKLANNWNIYKGNYKNNLIANDRLRYDVLFHTDLNRTHGQSNGNDLAYINWGNYDLVVIDESHNFRNGIGTHANTKENRYMQLMEKVIKQGVKTKVLMLSATPVNNRFVDLRNQLALAYEGVAEKLDQNLKIKRSVEDIFRQAQAAFNKWSKFESKERTTETLFSMLSFDFFEVLDSVTIARSRKHIQKYYDTKDIGTFPKRLHPISIQTPLTKDYNETTFNLIFEELNKLKLSVYVPSHFIHPSKRYKYDLNVDEETGSGGFDQMGRESGIRRLMAINLLKRLESSVYSFRLTVQRVKYYISQTIKVVEDFDETKNNSNINFTDISMDEDCDFDDQNASDIFAIGKKVKIALNDMDYISWLADLNLDFNILSGLESLIYDITPERDSKLQKLIEVICNKIENPINSGNKKVIVFSAFADTADYLYDNLNQFIKEKYGLNTAMISGTTDGKSTLEKFHCGLNAVLTYFSPISKDKAVIYPDDSRSIDILIATDCISEGQNLQDCDYLINYDIHWNPVRIIQRFGRIDRIGSKNDQIQLVNFWPDLTLDEYINLKGRVETRMKIVDMAATADDNILEEEQRDLEYRKEQLQKLKDEVVDIEEMSSGINIIDLGLNEFRLDLLEYVKEHGDLDNTAFGLHAVTKSKEDCPPGVIYVLKNRNNSVNIDNQNRLHPFYIVYIGENGEVVCNHLNPKNMLDKMRLMCKGQVEPIPEVYKQFNAETKDGRSMKTYNRLLGDSISSIIKVKDESDMDLFLSGQAVDFKHGQIKGLDDFELICFLVVKDE
ncbi:DEAD/DEAH box helicase family protein [Treponema parvum]|uniref:DEAD/DEAH box helicase family protein n=1 Tax=Treponema parvum TaxID=138851 RepID=A0A975F174_9SPIR|nr:helicase-related protein [Treponema parvum]QTQ12204.1 DEAD/DEAH box helicase family protein [Treponema parvum]